MDVAQAIKGAAVWVLLVLTMMGALPAAYAAPVELEGQLGEVQFELPDAEWTRYEGAVPSAAVLYQKTRELHFLLLEVDVVHLPGLWRGLSAEELMPLIIDATRANLQTVSPGLTFSGFTVGTRMVAGTPYRTVTFRGTNDVAVLDGVSAVYFPADLEERNRVYGVSWYDTRASNLRSLPTNDFDSVLSSLQVRDLGSVLRSDDFDDEAAGILPRSSPTPDTYTRGYVGGAYEMSKLADNNSTYLAAVPGTLGNTSLSVDVMTMRGLEAGASDAETSAHFWCRRFGTQSAGYRFSIRPYNGQFFLTRFDAGAMTELVTRTSAAILPPETWNHVDVACSGTTLSLSVNGELLTKIEDASYAQGSVQVGIGSQPGRRARLRFDNLVVTQS